jgi:outer membrane protein OmpA-like peptidoglycan-associated protein
LTIARGATCPSWLGRWTCAVSVKGRFDPPTAQASAAAACERSLAEIVGSTKIEFETGSAAISAGSAPVIDALARAATQCAGTIRVEGHTDSVGLAGANLALSDARAQAVVDALVQRGFSRDRLQGIGYGADRPIGDNQTAEGRALNRRIEFHVVSSP